MSLDKNNIVIDVKAQDKLRKWYAELSSNKNLKINTVTLGDSDIDYENSFQINDTRVLNAPYDVKNIKYPLIYNGLGKGVKGNIVCYNRFIDDTGNVSSYYDYPLTTTLSIGQIPPTIENGVEIDSITFTNDKMGVIVFIETLLDYYIDPLTGLPLRLKELYDIEVLFGVSTTVPTGWEVIIDTEHGSLCIMKDTTVVTTNYTGSINLNSKISKITKTIIFNF